MSAKTKIVVLHTKEVIYTVLFVVLAIVLAVLLFLMFGKDKKTTSFSGSPAKYHAGIYKSPITLDTTPLMSKSRSMNMKSPLSP